MFTVTTGTARLNRPARAFCTALTRPGTVATAAGAGAGGRTGSVAGSVVGSGLAAGLVATRKEDRMLVEEYVTGDAPPLEDALALAMAPSRCDVDDEVEERELEGVAVLGLGLGSAPANMGKVAGGLAAAWGAGAGAELRMYWAGSTASGAGAPPGADMGARVCRSARVFLGKGIRVCPPARVRSCCMAEPMRCWLCRARVTRRGCSPLDMPQAGCWAATCLNPSAPFWPVWAASNPRGQSVQPDWSPTAESL